MQGGVLLTHTFPSVPFLKLFDAQLCTKWPTTTHYITGGNVLVEDDAGTAETHLMNTLYTNVEATPRSH